MYDGPIKHVVVLMMENHSFDHVLGRFPGIGTLATTPQCLPDPRDNGASCCTYAWNAWAIDPCPNHAHANVMAQLYGQAAMGRQPPWPNPAPMSGFLTDYYAGVNYTSSYPQGTPTTPGDPALLMGGFAPGELPVTTALAQQFTVCTNWFASVPGPTGPNRLFANCASAGGYAGGAYQGSTMPIQLAALTSVFARLEANQRTWQIYHEDADFAPELVLDTVRDQPSAIAADPGFARFLCDAANGTLADYVFLTPSLPNSQHDSWDARQGDTTIGCIYQALIDSPLWEETLFLVTYDEHGGHFDHVPPPLTYTNDGGEQVTIANPDGNQWTADAWGADFVGPAFDFTCLGVRVPAIVVSAYTRAGVDPTVYEHASISATLDAVFGIGTLTARDETANAFLKNVDPAAKRSRDSLPRPVPAVIGKPGPAGQLVR